MKAADLPLQRPRDAKLLVVDAAGRLHHAQRSRLAEFLCPGDLLVANDAATLPASLSGTHLRSAAGIEVRLAGRRSLAADDLRAFSAIVFGAGDHRTPTEHRTAPPALRAGDALALGPLRASVTRTLGHPRLIELRFEGSTDAIWAGIAHHGRPIQYAHIAPPLALWDVWTSVAAWPVAFEPPSAGFVLDWSLLHTLRSTGIGFATLTHAAGISSTGDAALDARLPFDEPYHLPEATVQAIARAQREGGRIIALGTTVARALEHAASQGDVALPLSLIPAGDGRRNAASLGRSMDLPLRSGAGVADQRLGAHTVLRVVDAIVSGTHEIGTPHHALLRAFASEALLARADAALAQHGYRTHEFGDSVLIERPASPRRCARVMSVWDGARASPALHLGSIGSSRQLQT